MEDRRSRELRRAVVIGNVGDTRSERIGRRQVLDGSVVFLEAETLRTDNLQAFRAA